MATAMAVMAGALGRLWMQQVTSVRRHEQFLTQRLEELQCRVVGTETECRSLMIKLGVLERENARLLSQFVILSSSHDSSPLPQWIKDEDGKVIAVNKSYEKLYLTPRGYAREDYLHHTDRAVWPDDVAAAFAVNDKIVWSEQRTIDVEEPIEFPSGERRLVRVIKYPRFADGIPQPIGIAGIAIPVSVAGLTTTG